MAFKKKTVAAQVDETTKTEAVSFAGKLTLDNVTSDLGKIQVKVQKSLADVGTVLTEELSKLNTVKVAIQAQEEKLKNLYGIEASAASLEEVNNKLVEAEAGFEKRVDEINIAEVEILNDNTKKRKREEDEFAYNLAIRRRKEQAEWDAKFASIRSELDIREAAIREREAKMKTLEETVAGMQATIDKEVRAAVAIATNSLKKDYETQKLLDKAAYDTKIQLADQRNLGLEASLKVKDQEVASLKQDLSQARTDVKTISEKALESASGRSALEAVQNSNRSQEVVTGSGRGR